MIWKNNASLFNIALFRNSGWLLEERMSDFLLGFILFWEYIIFGWQYRIKYFNPFFCLITVYVYFLSVREFYLSVGRTAQGIFNGLYVNRQFKSDKLSFPDAWRVTFKKIIQFDGDNCWKLRNFSSADVHIVSLWWPLSLSHRWLVIIIIKFLTSDVWNFYKIWVID